MISPIIGFLCFITVGLLCLIRPRWIYNYYRNGYLSGLEGMSIKNRPDWLPEAPTKEAMLVIRLIGIFTLIFMFVFIYHLLIRHYYVH